MAREPVGQTLGDQLALRDELDRRWDDGADRRQEQGVVRAPEQHARRRVGAGEEGIEVLVQVVVDPRSLPLARLHERHPQGAGLFEQAQMGRQLGELERVRARCDRARGAQHRHGSRRQRRPGHAGNGPGRQPGQGLGRRAHHAQNTAIRPVHRQVALLQGAQRLRRCRVAGQQDQRTAPRRRGARPPRG